MRRTILTLLVAATLALSGASSHAQTAPQGPPNALQGFSQNRDQPVHIEAATLEVRDKQKQATFSGDVRVKQGDTGLRCKSLVVFYEQDGEAADQRQDRCRPLLPVRGASNGSSALKRVAASIVTQKEQTATGDLGIFDMKANTVTLTGNPVVMTQGQNVLRGEKLVVDLTSGVSRVESNKGGQGRVQGLFQPGSAGLEKPGSNGAQAPRPVPVRPFN